MESDDTTPDASKTTSLWHPWNRPAGTIIHLHEYCPIPYLVTTTEENPPMNESTAHLWFIGEKTRQFIRYTPLLIFLVVLFTKVIPLIGDLYILPDSAAVFTVFPDIFGFSPIGKMTFWIGTITAWIGVLLYFTINSLPTDSRESPPYEQAIAALFIYALLGLLAFWSITALIHRPPTGIRELYIDAGYWFAFLLGGLLVYDGILRTENLFWKLDAAAIIQNQQDGPYYYKKYRNVLANSLDTNDRLIPRYLVFAGIFVILFIGIDIANFKTGRTILMSSHPYDLPLNLIRVGFSFFLVIVAFQFIKLTTFIYRLTTTNTQNKPHTIPILGYQPFHPDGVGGYADLGKFAIRVNIILILSGLYLAYQTIIRGPTPESIIPFIAYGIITGTWFYASFWRLHRKMLTERRRWRESQGPPPGTKPLKTHTHTHDTTPKTFDDAPVWPISDRALQSILSANLLPLIIGLMNILVT